MLLVISELGLGIATCMESSSSVWLHDSEVPRDQLHCLAAWRKFERHATVTASPFTLFSPHKKSVLHRRLRHELLHDLITQAACWSFQYGFVVLGIVDAFVFAHNHHRHNTDNPGNFEDCMEELICVITALTPAYARAFQNLCPVGHSDAISVRERQTLRSQGQFIGAYQMFAQLRAEVVMSLRVEPFFTDGGTHTNDGETTAGWTAITRSPLGSVTSCFGPVITAEKHMWPVLEQASTPTTQLNSRASLGPFVSFSSTGPAPRGSLACIFYDS